MGASVHIYLAPENDVLAANDVGFSGDFVPSVLMSSRYV